VSKTCPGCREAAATDDRLCADCAAALQRIADDMQALANALETASDRELNGESAPRYAAQEEGEPS